MTAAQGAQVSEAQIAVHWREEEYYHRRRSSSPRRTDSDPATVRALQEEHFPECFKEYADLLTWDRYWHTTLDTSNPPFWKWFVGGRLNASYNCVDRHLGHAVGTRHAFIWVPEPEDGGDAGDHIPGAVSPGERVRGAAARSSAA